MRASGANTGKTAPLAAVLALTWWGNWGTSVGWSAVYFLAEERYGFGPRENLILGAIGGFGYVLTALASGRICALAQRTFAMSHRTVLAIVLVLMGVCALVPALVSSRWGIWCFAATFVPLQGVLWPIVESFMSGGRRGRSLRRAIGWFNLVWSSAVAMAMWFVALTIERSAVASFVALGVIQAIMLIALAWFPRDPAPSVEVVSEEGERADERRERTLLTSFRVLNFLSYTLLAALSPLLPALMGKLAIGLSMKPALASAWMVSRVAMFGVMQSWEGWHGRWRTVVWSVALVLAGFAAALLAPNTAVLVLGLVSFGLGAGAIYCAAIYYALEVGHASVDAGGKHEALMGVGYGLGPAAAMLFRGITGR